MQRPQETAARMRAPRRESTVRAGGFSNSRSADKYGHPCSVETAGIDTWSICWRVAEGSPAERAMRSLASQKIARGSRLPDTLAGHVVGWFPSARLVFAEGHPGGEHLGRPDDLAAVALGVQGAMHDYGIPVPRNVAAWDRAGSTGFVGVRRLDVTADLRFNSQAEGLAVMAGIAAMQLPRMKSAAWRGARGHLETVAFYGYTGKRMLGRWYDKGVESSSAKRGTLLRPEDQRRWGSGSRRDIEELTASYVRGKWVDRFMPLWKATKGVTVGSPLVIANKLGRLVDEKRITPAAARSVAGYLLLEPAGVPQGSARTARRMRSTARQHGLVLVEPGHEEVEVDLHAVLDAALDGPAWGCG